MADLIGAMHQALADTWGFYFQSHSFHWNVEGPLFSQYHKFFGDIYEDAFDAVDGLSEHIRTLGEYAPTSLTAIDAHSKINAGDIPDAAGMISSLRDDNAKVIESLNDAQQAATMNGQDGLANYLQERLDRHKKWEWMLSASADGSLPLSRGRLRYSRSI